MHRLVPATILALCTTGAAASYTLPVNLGSVSNPGILQADKALERPGLNAAQRAALGRNGFVITPATWRQFDAAYEAYRYADQPVFVTTDSMLHIYHLVFDKLLRDLERESLAPALRRMTALLVADAVKLHANLKGHPLERDALTTVAYLAVAQKLIDPAARVPAAVQAPVAAELRSIDAHAGLGASSVFSASQMIEDYSQYVPRGHYTRSDLFKRYFRSMMWLGRVNLRVQNAGETRTAALLTHLITNNAEVRALWARLYDPTALLVGRSDDLDYRHYAAALTQATGGQIRRLAEPGTLKALQSALAKLPPPQVNSVFVQARPGEGREVRERETLGFRMMGQRFTLDGAALQRLVYREVGTDRQPRLFPRGLDLLAGLGSDAALNILRGQGEARYVNYDAQMNLVRAAFAALKPTDWNTSVYSGWIYTLQGLAKPDPRDDRYPAFMRTPAWTRKEFLTALGSWTELKHDTLLYAKQVMAEMGAGGDPPKYPRAYVEPNPAVWSRLANLERLTRRVLTEQRLLTEGTAYRLDELRDMLALLSKATGAQLSGKLLSRDENDRLHFYGGWLEQMKMSSADTDGPEGGSPEFDENAMAAVVADVATAENTALQEGTGFIHDLYAVVPDWNGRLQVAHGGVYSQYEFTVPSSGRLTDEAWRAQLSRGQVPPMHAWLDGVVVK
ncbi:DUF3160 domain-containing protein [Deinococcus enclensis]|uniref:DUF3160 domain-containing protein n=1 Tax=Deinococcus enclensis TaxID=1049582 RepID=A0ABT9MI94_9DEIO|nr:DUF3160 domain-containing protein [Deinococcus enclensis]MDP9766194.1 hypothetical protein [Deinococcus enclensis]